MSIWIDVKYLNLVSSKLSFFKKKGDNLWNFRCPVCGDSEKKKSKARGYVYKKGNDLFLIYSPQREQLFQSFQHLLSGA